MKKLFLTLALAVAALPNCFADEFMFNISRSDNPDILLTVPFSEEPTLTYQTVNSANYLAVTFQKEGETEPMVRYYNLSNNYDITYTKAVPEAIKQLAAKGNLNFNGNNAFVTGLAAGQQAMVFDEGGRCLGKYNANEAGAVAIDLSSVAADVVIVKAGNSSFKIRK